VTLLTFRFDRHHPQMSSTIVVLLSKPLRVYHKSNFASDAVMLSLSEHLKGYLGRSFDRLRMTNLSLWCNLRLH